MVPRVNRSTSSLVEQVNKNGLSAHGIMASLRLLFVSGATGWKISVVVPKKIAKTAVLRNKLRRQWYEYIRKSEKIKKTLTDKAVTVCVVSVKSLKSPIPLETELEILNLIDKASQKDRIRR